MPPPSTRRISWLVWLLCFVILTASLDRISDPPATKQAGVEVNAFMLNHATDAVSPQSCFGGYHGQLVQFEACWFGAGEVSASGHPDRGASLVHHAADPSPPDLIFLPA
jgi:hypothetical protein